MCCFCDSSFSFFTDTASTEIYTLSLHDALPILYLAVPCSGRILHTLNHRLFRDQITYIVGGFADDVGDRKSTRLNSSHVRISYAVFCLKKKKQSTWFTLFFFTYSQPLTRLLFPT